MRMSSVLPTPYNKACASPSDIRLTRLRASSIELASPRASSNRASDSRELDGVIFGLNAVVDPGQDVRVQVDHAGFSVSDVRGRVINRSIDS